MRAARPRSRAARGAALLALLLTAGVVGAGAGGAGPSARAGIPVDGAAFYNAGTDALQRGDLGPAVAFLRAAQRIDPRAADIRRNLAEARARVAAERGSVETAAPPPVGAVPLSSAEAWWIAALLLLLGAALALGGVLHRRSEDGPATGSPRAISLASRSLLVGGLLLAAILAFAARLDSIHPEAVVVVPVLEVGPAPEEKPRPPYLLGAGEEVRLGRERGTLVEIRLGGAGIGWASRSGVWRVADAARYTPRLP